MTIAPTKLFFGTEARFCRFHSFPYKFLKTKNKDNITLLLLRIKTYHLRGEKLHEYSKMHKWKKILQYTRRKRPYKY